MIATNKLIEKISDIVYHTVEEYKKSEHFKNRHLEDYDNWKDTIVERFVRLLHNEVN